MPTEPVQRDGSSQSASAISKSSETILLASNGVIADPVAATVSENLLVKPALVTPIPVRPEISGRQRGTFYAFMAAEHASAVLDAWSTRAVLRQGGRELDPLVRPFAHSAILYPALQVAPFGVDYFASRLMRSNHRLLRKLWWVPQAVATGGSVYCGITNLGNVR
ncbi:MAG TPA: hypothetical protein VG498_20960 [Terriglobales bacterium]|nr:hypothetical protein [Terriglobales bacterium]